MAKRKVNQTADEVVVEQEYSNAEVPFWQKNQNYILYGIVALAVLFLGWWLYKTQMVAPKNQEAIASMWHAERMFEQDSFASALNGPAGGYDGFLAIADKYSGTAAGNAAKYYAGICYLQTGDFDNAISFLESASAEGNVLPALRYGALGDAYSEKKDFGKALDLYEKAASATKNDVLAAHYLRKLGMLNEFQGNKEAAKAAYERLRTQYPNPSSQEWREIEKYIYRLN
jgi:tetratricopeptide (TPR) repeat protein